MYLVVIHYNIQNELMFPKHEQIEQFLNDRHWKPVFREAPIEAGLVLTSDSEEDLGAYIRPRLDPSETATIFRLRSDTAAPPAFPDMAALWSWATAHSYSETAI